MIILNARFGGTQASPHWEGVEGVRCDFKLVRPERGW